MKRKGKTILNKTRVWVGFEASTSCENIKYG